MSIMKRFGNYYINFNNVIYIVEAAGTTITLYFTNTTMVINSDDAQYEPIREYINKAF